MGSWDLQTPRLGPEGAKDLEGLQKMAIRRADFCFFFLFFWLELAVPPDSGIFWLELRALGATLQDFDP